MKRYWPSSPEPKPRDPLFKSFFLGGFECSCHRLEDGTRLDLLESTGHARFAGADYCRLVELGIEACRDGIPWTRVEAHPGRYDFSTATLMLRAADALGIKV